MSIPAVSVFAVRHSRKLFVALVFSLFVVFGFFFILPILLLLLCIFFLLYYFFIIIDFDA